MSQQELANKCGVDRSYISKLEQPNTINNTRSPKLALLLNIALALEVCPNSILIYSCDTCLLSEGCKKKERFENIDLHDEDYNFQLLIFIIIS